ncbi:hypothetical protein [Streptacidiphilus jiangxiensis]|uniref:Lipopolysaccharide assembly protein A domain-containing protein n=1 Tax=Streptacidiphilus jiangxiensis TaxID=235985 RepID=A0A1H7NSC5_STRJI|nr:hypothetical protein [Streptacidiphilus jiangxiensis]SEL26470.1 hypothetical protein SAMN05414137_10757 [Streptacidiphilus jiangxiensis]
MIIVLGLVILVAAAVLALAGFFGNTGSAHAVNGAFSVFGHHLTGSTGTLFLFGVIVGAAGMLGLGLLLTGARRSSRRGLEARRALRHARRETAVADKDRAVLVDQRDAARTEAATADRERDAAAEQRDGLLRTIRRVGTGSPGTRTGEPESGREPGLDEPESRWRRMGHRAGRG